MKKIMIMTLSVMMFSITSSYAGSEKCDVLLESESITKGLYGLCIAYHEGMKADIDPSMTLEELSLETKGKGFGQAMAARRVLTNYEKKAKSTDPKMPGVNYASEECIFVDPSFYDNFGTLGPDAVFSVNEYPTSSSIVEYKLGTRYISDVYMISTTANYTGQYIGTTWVKRTSSSGAILENEYNNVLITQAEYETCRAVFKAKGAELQSARQ